jgi:predicted transcriptional regulator
MYGVIVLVIGFLALGICQGSPSWESEDFPIKPVREVHRKQPTPLQTKDSAVTVDKKPEKAAVSDDLGKTKFVHSVMIKTPYYCRANQSEEEALKLLRELNLPYLPVLDSNLRVVGVVSMRDLMRSKEQKDPPQSGK